MSRGTKTRSRKKPPGWTLDRIEELNLEFHDGWGPDLGYLLLTTDFRKPQATDGV